MLVGDIDAVVKRFYHSDPNVVSLVDLGLKIVSNNGPQNSQPDTHAIDPHILNRVYEKIS